MKRMLSEAWRLLVLALLSAVGTARFCPRCGVVLLPPSGAAALPRCPDPRDHAAGCSCRRCYYGVDE
jgi:hypothetical protein